MNAYKRGGSSAYAQQMIDEAQRARANQVNATRTPSYQQRLEQAQMAQAHTNAVSRSSPTLRYGSRGDSVKKLQQYLGISADGIFGPQTLSAVRAYQKSHGLGVDGIVGNHTWTSLLSGGGVHHSSSPAPSPTQSVPSYRPSTTSTPTVKPSGGGGSPSSSSSAPSIAPIDFSKYNWTAATLSDLAKKYGVDYSMEAAKRMAEAQAQDKKNALNTQVSQNNNQHQQVLKQLSDALNSGLANTDQSYFLKGLDQQQQLANKGINAGLANDANLRLAMAKQNAIGALSNTNQQQMGAENNRYGTTQQSINQALADLASQTTSNAQNIYDTRLQQAYAQLNAMNSQRRQDALSRLQAALSQRGQNINLKQLQDQNAWQVYNLGQQIGYQNSLGFNSGSGGGGNYQSDLSKAVQLAHIPASQLDAFNWIIKNESSFNPSAKNPDSSAHGYGQFLNQTVANYDRKTGLHYNSSPVDQLIETYKYMVDRYGSPQAAKEFWLRHHWY